MISVAKGQLLPELDPRIPEPEAIESLPEVRTEAVRQDDGGRVLINKLTRIILNNWDGEELRSLGEGVSAAKGLIVPSPRKLVGMLEKWRGGALSENGLIELADAILVHYDREGYPVLLLDVPEQDFASGELRFQIEVGRIGEAGVAKPAYGSPDALRKGLRLRPGQLISRMAIDEQMNWYGRNIFRTPKLYVTPGEEIASADLLIAFEESKPWQVNVGYENNGPDNIGRDRFTFGAVGMTKGEQLIGWQTTLGAPASLLQAHSLHWEVPFHERHQSLIFDASYAQVNSSSLTTGGVVQNDGTSWAVSASQRFLFESPAGWRQQLTVGVDLKSTDQFALFGAISLAPGEVRFLQAKAAYEVSRTWESGSAALAASLVASPGNLISGNSDADFRAYDPQADANYHIARLAGQAWWSPGGDWRLLVRGSGQWTDSRLLPAEQFAVGGALTVRGASERQFFADNGWQTSFEAYTPGWSPLDRCQMRFLGFFDYAWLQSRGQSSESLNSVGLGVRAMFTERFELRADHGWMLDDSENRGHIGLTMTF